MKIPRRGLLLLTVLAILVYYVLLQWKVVNSKFINGKQFDHEIQRKPSQAESKEAKVNNILIFISKIARLPMESLFRVRQVLLRQPQVPSFFPNAAEKRDEGLLTTLIPPVIRVTHNKTWHGYKLPILTCNYEGQLGNVLGQYATMYALNKIYNVTIVMRKEMRERLKNFPNLSLPQLTVPYKAEEWQPITYWGDMMSINYASIEIAASGLLGPRLFVMQGYPLEIQLFHQFKEELKREFVFSSNITTQVQTFLKGIAESRYKDGYSDCIFIGFHVRMKNYFVHIQHYGGKLPEDIYFHRAFNYYREKFPKRAVFIASSDDAEYVRTKFETYSDVYFSPGASAELDMAVLSSCNHSIVTVGSYGFWSGFLAGGEVVYPDVKVERAYSFSRPFYEKIGIKSFTPLPVD